MLSTPRKNLLQTLSLVGLALLVSIRSITFGLTLDDFPHLEEAKLNSHNLELIFENGTWPGNLYRPIYSGSLALGNLIHGLAFPFLHLENILLYCLVTLAVFKLLSSLFKVETAWLAALIFACMPIHTEVVSAISFRTELLSCLFVLLCLIQCEKGKWKTGNLFLLLALFSKESSLVAIPLISMIVYFKGSDLKTSFVKGLYLIGPALLYLLTRHLVFGDIKGPEGGVPFIDNPLISLGLAERVFSATALLGKYMFLSFIPLELSSDYTHAKLANYYQGPVNFEIIAFFLLAISFLIIGLMRVRTWVGFSAGWFFVSFAITGNVLIAIGTIFGERLAFLPSIGLCLFLAQSINLLSSKKFKATLTTILIIFYSFTFFIETAKWENNKTLLAVEEHRSSQSARLKQGLGFIYGKAGDNEAAREKFLEAIKIYPEYPRAHYGLGKVETTVGNLEKAEEHFQRALEIQPTFPKALNAMGQIELVKNNPLKAGEYFTRALNHNNYDLEALRGMIMVSKKLNHLTQVEKLKKLYLKYSAGWN